MIATWMGYSVAVGLLVMIAATALDRGARANRLQTRHVWTAALVLAALLPIVLPILPKAPVTETTAGVSTGPVQLGPSDAAVGSQESSLVARLAAMTAHIDGPLLALWLGLTLVLLGRVLVASLKLWRQRHQWVEREIDGVPLFVTPDLGPAVVALPDSCILVPEWMLALDPAELSTVIRHEREHRATGDARVLLGGSIAVALLPWNPAVWLLRRRLRLAVEMDCDARVLRADPRVDRYGSLLLAIAQHPRHAPRLAAALTESTSDLERRIDAMTTRPPRSPRTRGLVLATLAAAAVAFACALPGPDVVAPRTNADAGRPKPADNPLFDFQVESQVAADPSNLPPRYPSKLRAANIEGQVIAKFVVDTNGRADMRSFEIVKSDHDAFTAAVREAMPQMKFFPAEVGGRKVKQLMQMPFTFSLVRGSRTPTDADVAGATRIVGQRPIPPALFAEMKAMVESATRVANAVSEVMPVVTVPSVPVYPNQLRAANIEGQVLASFVVRADGTVDMSTFTVEKSDHDAFTASVRNAMEKIRFKPARDKDGNPVAATMRMPFMFSLAR